MSKTACDYICEQCPIGMNEQEGNKALLIVCFSIAFGLGVLTGTIICAFCA